MPGEIAQRGGEIALDAASGRATVNARTMYLALLTVAPDDATTMATMTEVSTAGYARQIVTWSAPTTTDPPTIRNSTVITFGPFTADPPNVVGAALVSALTGTAGELTMRWTLEIARDPQINESIQFAVNQLSMSND